MLKIGLMKRMLLLVGLAVLLVLCALVAYYGVTMRSFAVDAYEKLARSEAERYSLVIEQKVDYAFSVARAMAFELQAYSEIPLQERRAVTNALLVSLYGGVKDELVDIWTVWEPDAFDGRDAEFAGVKPEQDASGRYVPAVSGGGIEPTGAYDSDWYTTTVRDKIEFASEPYDYLYVNDNRTVKLVTLSVPVVVNGKGIGAVGTDLDLDGLMKMVGSLYDNGSKAVLLTDEGTFLVAHSEAAEGKNIADVSGDLAGVFKQALAGKTSQGLTTNPDNGEETYLVYTPIKIGRTGAPWVLGVHIPASLVFAQANSSALTAAASGVAALALLLLLVALIARSIVKPLQRVSTAAGLVAAGNLDVALEGGRRGDEVGDLVRALQTMIVNLRHKIQDAEEKTRQAAQESERAHEATRNAEESARLAEEGQGALMATAGSVGEVVENLNSAIRSLSEHIDVAGRSVDVQSERVSETTAAMAEMCATVESVAQNAGQSSQASDKARTTAQHGAAVVQSSVDSILTVEKAVLELKEKMAHLHEMTKAIDNIITVISDIADQTNLLALNAAIEAARAGESGRGFAVVADEVRKLAEKTMHATQEVAETTTNINRGIDDSLAGVERAVADIADSTRHAAASGEALQAIVAEVDDISGQINHIAVAAQQQLAACESINKAMEDAARITVDTNKAMAESTTSVHDITRQSDALKGLMDGLLKN